MFTAPLVAGTVAPGRGSSALTYPLANVQTLSAATVNNLLMLSTVRRWAVLWRAARKKKGGLNRGRPVESQTGSLELRRKPEEDHAPKQVIRRVRVWRAGLRDQRVHQRW